MLPDSPHVHESSAGVIHLDENYGFDLMTDLEPGRAVQAFFDDRHLTILTVKRLTALVRELAGSEGVGGLLVGLPSMDGLHWAKAQRKLFIGHPFHIRLDGGATITTVGPIESLSYFQHGLPSS
jgi:hypothetical protein